MFQYARRVKNSFGGMIVGIILIPLAALLHGWNEYRTVHRSRGLAEAAAEVQTIADANELSSQFNEKLVHLSGVATTDETLQDPEFLIRENAIHLRRHVEMYQWVEHKESRTQSNESKSASYSYELVWSSDEVDSGSFHRPTGHENPSMKFRNTEWSASRVHIGAYQLSSRLTASIDAWETIEVPFAAIVENLAEAERLQYLEHDGLLYWSSSNPDPERPNVGDLRIKFEKVAPATVSLVAQLLGDTLGQFKTSNGEKIESLYLGQLTASEVMDKLVTENTVIAWALRAFGFMLCVGGFALALKPISAMLSFLPFMGELTGGLTLIVAIFLGAIVSLVAIGLSWIAVRPLLGLTLLGVAALALAGLWRMRTSNQPTVIDESMLVK